jgi:tetratricopeptide (TPR) repeat protein
MLELLNRRYIFICLFAGVCLFFLFSAEELSPFQEDAQVYRNRGLQFQQQGRLNEAMTCYQKAITLDPNFVIAYNDLGIIYEAKGWLDKAEEVYLAGLEVNPDYPSLCSNLAMLCEQKGDYKRAATFWKKRIKLGNLDEAWTEKAKARLEAVRRAVPELRQEYLQDEAAELARELSIKKQARRLKDLAEARRLFDDAKRLYQNAEYEKALNSVNLALSLNLEDNEDLLRLKEEINIKLMQQDNF